MGRDRDWIKEVHWHVPFLLLLVQAAAVTAVGQIAEHIHTSRHILDGKC